MNLVKWDRNSIDGLYMAKTKNQPIIEEFIASGMDCAKVTGWENKSAANCAASMNQTIKKFKYHGVKAISRRDEVYFIKTK